MVRHSVTCGLVVVLAMAGGSSAAATEPDPIVTFDAGVAPLPELDLVYERFAEGYLTLDATAVADLYTEDALYLSPRSGIDRGRATIRQGFERIFGSARERGQQLRISFQLVSRHLSGALAADVGIYTLVRSRGGQEVRRSRGKFIVVARRDAGGAWRFGVDGYSELEPESEPTGIPEPKSD